MKVIPVMNYATPSVAEVESKKKEVDFGAAQPATVAKASSHVGRKIGLALAVPALALAAVLSLGSCANPAGNNIDPTQPTQPTDPTDPTDPTQPPQSPVASAMQTIFDVLKVGSPAKSISASLVSKNAYAPVAGDVTAISYHDDFGGGSATSFTLDNTKSTSDALVYNVKSIDDVFSVETDDTCTVSKTDSGVKYQYGSGIAHEYVAKEGYVMVYSVNKDGTKTEYERQYPGDTPNSVKMTTPDGGKPVGVSTYSNYTVTYSN